MTSESPSRPLAGVSLPRWMKSRMHDRYDLDEAAFSPPSQDDGFFLIRYGKSRSEEVTVDDSGYRPIGQVLREHNFEQKHKLADSAALQKHTEQCQLFIPQAKYSPREIGLMRVSESASEKIKSVGTDDGFKGDAAACGFSVLQVAQNMVAGGEARAGVAAVTQRVRRNSKSLPASPLSSPSLPRRNLFFTDALFGSTEGVDTLSHRLGTVSIGATAAPATAVSSERLSHIQPEPESQPPAKQNILRPRPTHLREMNFWSPTSM